MRAVLLACSLLVVAQPCAAAVAHAKDGAGFCNSTTNGGDVTAVCAASTETISYTANATGGQVLVYGTCFNASATPSAVALTATGWTFTQVGSIVGSTANGFGALFKAYAPNTSAATLSLVFTTSGNCSTFMSNLIGEFSGGDGTNFVDASVLKTGTTGCPSGTAGNGVTPTVANDGIWFACNDNVSGVAGGYTKGGDDANSDWSEWKILVGGSGTEQFSSFTTSSNFTMAGVAIKPAGAGGCTLSPTLTLLGVGNCQGH